MKKTKFVLKKFLSLTIALLVVLSIFSPCMTLDAKAEIDVYLYNWFARQK